MSVFVNLTKVNTLVEPCMHSLAESLVVLPGQLAVHSCWALAAVASQSKEVSQRVADRLLFALTNCSEKDKLLVCILFLGCTDMYRQVAFASVSTVVSS